MEIDDGLLAFGAEEESAVAARVHEEIFYENGRRKGPSEKVEVGLQVGVAVGVVGTESLAGEVELGTFIETGGEGIGPGVSPGGVGALAGGVVPAVAPAGGVGVDGDEDDVVPAEEAAAFVDAAASLGQRDVFLFGNEEGGVVAEVGEGGDHPACNEAVPGVLPEHPVWAALARRVDAVTVVDKDFRTASDSRCALTIVPIVRFHRLFFRLGF